MDFLILLSLCLVSWRGAWGQKDANNNVVEAEEGDVASIPCTAYRAEQSSNASVQWLYEKNSVQKIVAIGPHGTVKEDSELKERVNLENVTLIISGVRVQDERTYICQVEKSSVDIAESKVRLRVYKAPEFPEIKLPTAGLPVNEKAEVATCESKNGFPAPNIAWYKNGFPLQHDHDGVEVSYQNTQESSGLVTVMSILNMQVVQSDNDAVLYCEVSYHVPGGDFMMESKKENLTVYYPNTKVTLYKEKPSGSVKEGDTVELRCVGDGNPQPEITISKKDTDGSSLVEQPSLILENVQRGASGGYVCTGIDYSDGYHEASAEIELHVHFLDPPIFSEKSPLLVNLGDNLSVSCEVNGSSKAEIVWQKNGKDYFHGDLLNLDEVDYDISGNYTCFVHLPDVPELNVTNNLEIVVAGKPDVSVSSKVLSVNENELVTVTCRAIGHPAADITWSINGSVDGNIDELEVTSELTFRVTQDLINTSISCVATNLYGSSEEEIQLEQSAEMTVSTVIPVTDLVTTAVAVSGSEENVIQETTRAGSHGVIIVVVIVCILLLAILGAVLYFLYKKGRISCGRSGKQDITRPGEKEHIVVEMKPDSPAEESVLLPGSQEKKPPGDQEKYMDIRN
ncbi:cell surface glycoprotein MUC18 isoform X2 [Pelobates fuscus]|uniref:cell surface glycoprotein MUC18 isoform X2 n=1 Tax=Pelobates fuscus TaxID=191477 RepID=UPI002FE46F9C